MDIECTSEAQVFRLLHEIKERVNAIESYLCSLDRVPIDKSSKINNNNCGTYSGHKTKDGYFVDSTDKKWLKHIQKKPVRVLYRETLHHSKCCLCQTDDITVTAKTIKKKHKSYIIPLCGACISGFEKRQVVNRDQKSIYWRSVIKTPFETNRRKF